MSGTAVNTYVYTDTMPVMSRIKESPKLISAVSISAKKELKGIVA
jgi:hypothetical protein